MNNWNSLVDTIKEIDKNNSKILNENSGSAATTAPPASRGKTIAKNAGKFGSKFISGVGTALSFMDAWNRWQSGDRSGAVISAL